MALSWPMASCRTRTATAVDLPVWRGARIMIRLLASVRTSFWNSSGWKPRVVSAQSTIFSGSGSGSWITGGGSGSGSGSGSWITGGGSGGVISFVINEFWVDPLIAPRRSRRRRERSIWSRWRARKFRRAWLRSMVPPSAPARFSAMRLSLPSSLSLGVACAMLARTS